MSLEQSRIKVNQALSAKGIVSLYESRFRAAYLNTPKLLIADRFAIYDCDTETPDCSPSYRLQKGTGGQRRKRIPFLAEEQQEVLDPTNNKECLERLDLAADTLTTLFIEGGILHQSGTLNKQQPSPEIILSTPDSPVESLRKIILHKKVEKDPLVITTWYHPSHFQWAGFNVTTDYDPDIQYSGGLSRGYVYMLFPNAAKELPNGFKFSEDYVITWDTMSLASDFWSDLDRATLAILNGSPVQKGIGQGPFGPPDKAVRTLTGSSDTVVEEVYTLETAAQDLRYAVVHDLRNAYSELYPRKSLYYSATGAFRRFLSGK